MNDLSFSVLLGQTLESVDGAVGDGELIFTTADGRTFKLFHDQDCCESVAVEDIVGDLSDLVGSPITLAEKSVGGDDPEGYTPPEYRDSYTWTFYRIATAKGHVDIRWLGTSNGYYSEGVSFAEVTQ